MHPFNHTEDYTANLHRALQLGIEEVLSNKDPTIFNETIKQVADRHGNQMALRVAEHFLDLGTQLELNHLEPPTIRTGHQSLFGIEEAISTGDMTKFTEGIKQIEQRFGPNIAKLAELNFLDLATQLELKRHENKT